MKIIKKIEVNYLRSLYSATLDDVGDLNVIFGRNDSGKSNLLRALNLFFNGHTEPDREFEFGLDMSDRRKQEARHAKGRQFIWIKITFRVPANYNGALGDEITIKRQWNRDGNITETVFPNIEGAGKLARLTRFLNEIDFTYIPAIKDLEVYADLIERMYGAASETANILDATNAFVSAIEGQTAALSQQLTKLFSAPARLAPPTAMSQLFRTLDFAHGEDGHSLLRQKGDGIKARHIPELLRYINDSESRNKFYLWGFEEPENSLDLGAAEAEAARFSEFAGRSDTQIFITSHSPAFYLVAENASTSIRRFFITKQQKSLDDIMSPSNAAALIDGLEDAELRMEQAGLLQLPFVIRRLSEQKLALEEKEAEAEALRAQIDKIQQPTLFVEGAHDVAMFESSLGRLGLKDRIAVRPLGGTPSTIDALFGAVMKHGGLEAEKPVLFLFDNDRAGRGAYKKFCGQSPKDRPVNYHNKMFVWALPFTTEFNKFSKRYDIQLDQAFFTAEFLFPLVRGAELCKELIEARGDEKAEEWLVQINGGYWDSLGQLKCQRLASADRGSIDWFLARGVPDFAKASFAEEAVARNFDTQHVDAVMKIAIEVIAEDLP